MPIRIGASADLERLEALYREAFPDEDLIPLLRELLREPVYILSLVFEDGPDIVGHAAFTPCAIDGSDAQAALLGPVAVSRRRQRLGIGSSLIIEGMARMEAAGCRHVFVLGDPVYYTRFGFAVEAAIAPPYTLPDAWRTAWQSVCLDDAPPVLDGSLIVPKPWRNIDLWQEGE